ncbi:hypothetical protein SH449x_000747 [Pirellulaceae bacterium SH449]
MASPTSSLATLRPELAGSLMEFDLAMNQRGFIASQVLPVIDVSYQSGNYGRIPIEELLQERETSRAPGSGYSRSKFNFKPESYACLENGAEEVIDDREAQMYAEYFDAELVATARAYSSVLVNQEKRVASKLFNTSVYTGVDFYLDTTVPWTQATYDTSKPIDDVQFAADKVYANTGLYANALICNRFVFRDLKRSEQIIDALVAMGAGNRSTLRDVTADQIAAALDLDMIIVAEGSRNSAAEGLNASIGQIWSSSYAMVARVCTTNDIREPGLGRTFHWSGDGSAVGGAVESYRDETVRGDVIRVRHDTDEKIHYFECGFLLKVD